MGTRRSRSSGMINKVLRNFRIILENLDDNLIGSKEVVTLIKSSAVTARKYISILKDADVVEYRMVMNHQSRQHSIMIKTKHTPITDELLERLRSMLYIKYVGKYKEHEDNAPEIPEIEFYQPKEGVTVVSSNDYHVKIDKKTRRYSASGDSFSAAYFNAIY